MDHGIFAEARKDLQKCMRYKNQRRVAAILTVLAMICTIFPVKIPAAAMEQNYTDGIIEDILPEEEDRAIEENSGEGSNVESGTEKVFLYEDEQILVKVILTDNQDGAAGTEYKASPADADYKASPSNAEYKVSLSSAEDEKVSADEKYKASPSNAEYEKVSVDEEHKATPSNAEQEDSSPNAECAATLSVLKGKASLSKAMRRITTSAYTDHKASPSDAEHGLLSAHTMAEEYKATPANAAEDAGDDNMEREITPENVQLCVRSITETDDSYDELSRQAADAVIGNSVQALFYDISFYTNDGEYLPVSDNASVSIQFKETVLTEETGDIVVLHYEEDSGALVEVGEVEVELDANEDLSALKFATQGFSVFAVVKVQSTDVTGLDGRKFVIANLNSSRKYAMTSTPNEDSSRLTAKSVSVLEEKGQAVYVSGDNLTCWEFIQVQNKRGYYYIRATDTGKYLSLTTNALTTSDTLQAIYVSTKTGDSGQVKLSANNTTVDWFGNNSANGDIFGPYNGDGPNNYQTLCELKEVPGKVLLYDLNIPGMENRGSGWKNKPSIDSSVQNIDENTAAIFGKPSNYYDKKGPAGIPGLYRFNIDNTDGNELPENLPDDMKNTWYGEMRFDGWEYTDQAGTVHLLSESAEIQETDNGLTATDTDGNMVTIPYSTVLKGRWTEVSNCITFYVNYTGTILDTEGDVSGRNQGHFTNTVAVGHVFYGKTTVGNDSKFAVQANAEITSMFRADFVPDEITPQIVIEYLREEDGITRNAHGANSVMVEETTLRWIKQTGKQIRLSTADNTNNPIIDSALCDTEHYQIRWYVLKEQTDTWHVDGVLVAKTSEMTVTKTVRGLTENEANKLLQKPEGGSGNEQGNFQVNLQLLSGNTPANYLTMTTNPDVGTKGQYQYYGMIKNGDIFTGYWTLNTITDEKYILTEKNYKLEGYDCSPRITIGTKEGGVYTKFVDSTAEFGATDLYPVVGGNTTLVSFSNYYTKESTGSFVIEKLDKTLSDHNSASAYLQGVKFTLEKAPDFKQTKATDRRGQIYFNNLEPGTYTLKETEAREGYSSLDKTWIVEVKGNPVTVSIKEDGTTEPSKILYAESTLRDVYRIDNTPSNSVLTVTKTFSGITKEESSEITTAPDNSGKRYKIEVRKKEENGNVGDLVEIFYTSNSEYGDDGQSYKWSKTVTPGDYYIIEYNYLHKNYKDTVVTATVNGKKEKVEINRSDGGKAVISVTATDQNTEEVALRNEYINTFRLSLKKVDSQTGEVLPGAVFKIYGDYESSSDTTDFQTVGEHRYYYHKNITTDQNGIAVMDGLKLSEIERGFVYVLTEIESPQYYRKLNSPILIKVDVNTENYEEGVYSLEVPNTSIDASDMTIEKRVTGAFGDRLKQFTFTLKIEKRDGTSITEPKILKEQKEIQYTKNSDGTISFTIGHGESVTLKGLPIKSTVQVTENTDERTGYKTSFEMDTGEQGTTKRSVFSASETASETYTISAASDSFKLTVTNERRAAAETGVWLPKMPYMLLLFVVVTGGFLLLLNRRRRWDEE